MILPIKIGVVTASDRCSRGERQDESGTLLKVLIEEHVSGEVIAYRVVPDDKECIQNVICHMVDTFFCDVVFTTGGTGLSPRDQTPEATRAIIEKEVPGIAEMVRMKSRRETKFAMLSRAVAGIRGKTLIINLPGSPKAVLCAFKVLEPMLLHAVKLIKGEVEDCQKLSYSLPSHSSSH